MNSKLGGSALILKYNANSITHIYHDDIWTWEVIWYSGLRIDYTMSDFFSRDPKESGALKIKYIRFIHKFIKQRNFYILRY